MATDHRGRPIGNLTTPHGGSVSRPQGRGNTPRLAQALAGLLNNTLEEHEYNEYSPEEGEDEFKMQHSMANNVSAPYGEQISEIDAQGALDKYRKDRNSGQDTEFYQEDIKDAYRTRNDY